MVKSTISSPTIINHCVVDYLTSLIPSSGDYKSCPPQYLVQRALWSALIMAISIKHVKWRMEGLEVAWQAVALDKGSLFLELYIYSAVPLQHSRFSVLCSP